MHMRIAVILGFMMAVGLPIYAVSQYRRGVVLVRHWGKVRRADSPLIFWAQIALELAIAVMAAIWAIRHL
jgi:hypothetical protein